MTQTSETETPKPFGSWQSPITAELVAAGGIGVGAIAAGVTSDGVTQHWWLESRPAEGGRVVLLASNQSTHTAQDMLCEPWSVRNRVHEYGGGAWWLGKEHAYFTNYADQCLYKIARTGNRPEPTAVTTASEMPAGLRYADGREHPDETWLVSVREDHSQGFNDGTGNAAGEPKNEIVSIDTNSGEQTIIVSGTDFVAEPRFSADGRWLSWVQWNHPNMPWDSTELCVAEVLGQGEIGEPLTVAGIAESAFGEYGPKTESVQGSGWTSDGRLVFSSDRDGFWNLYTWDTQGRESEKLTHFDGEEVSGSWGFGHQSWAEIGGHRLVMSVTKAARDSLKMVDANGSVTSLELAGESEIASISGLSAVGNSVIAAVGSTTQLPSIVKFDVQSENSSPKETVTVQAVRPPENLEGVTAQDISTAADVFFESDGCKVHAFFYAPKSSINGGSDQKASDRTSPNAARADGDDVKPPLIVMGHGGPTSHTVAALSLKIQYWTSRGFAVVDVNYRGSSGFGRVYREMLRGAWGIVDVADCIGAAQYLVAEGLVAGDQVCIRGGSAGGFTVLAALTQSDLFAAGTNLYGVADLKALAADTHKFESRYLDGLIGRWPEDEHIYTERSPINHTDKLSAPLLVLQGSEDEVVPPNQSEAIVAALAERGVPHAYVCFEGEQHGFRKSETIVRSLELELWFYAKVLGFEQFDSIEPAESAVGLR